MLLCFTTSLKNDGNFRNTFQKVHFQGHLWKENVASLLEESGVNWWEQTWEAGVVRPPREVQQVALCLACVGTW